MKILIINYMETTAPGGINKVVAEIGENLSDKGHEIIVLQPNPLNLPSEEVYKNFKIVRVKSIIGEIAYGLNPEMFFYLKKHIKKLNPDLVHVHGYHNLLSLEIIYTLRKISPNIPIIFSSHLDTYRSTFVGKYFWYLYNIFGKNLFKLSSTIISPSEFEAETIINVFHTPINKIAIIPHGVNEVNIDKKLTIENDRINLLYVGYLIKRKGIQFIIDSLFHLIYKQNIDNVSLTIIGEGSEKKKIMELIDDLNLSKYVVWGENLLQSELIKIYKKSDIVLLLSESEAYGIVVAEALACGTPVIVTKKTALTEFTKEPGCFGVDYPPKPEEVAKLIIKIVNIDVKVGPFSKKIRTWDEVTLDYEKIYLETLCRYSIEKKENQFVC